MTRPILLGTAPIPNTGKQLMLYRYADRFAITIPGHGELMNSRVHGSEKALAELACKRMGPGDRPRVLVGGLGMGFTLAAALQATGPDAEVVVAELVPEVVDWNREFFGEAAGNPLADPRTRVCIGDVSDLIRGQGEAFDAILLDVDNGPQAMIRGDNEWLYSVQGLQAARMALRPGGLLAVWSAAPDQKFSTRLSRAGFKSEVVVVRPHRPGKGPRHFIWIGT